MASPTSSLGTRERIVTATNELFRRRGYNGTSLAQIVEASQATIGSIYHFFPGGKDELTAEVLRSSGAAYGELVATIIRSAPDPAAGVVAAFDGAASVMAESGFVDPCPIGTIAREVASTNDHLRRVAAAVIEDWLTLLDSILSEAGIASHRSRTLASLIVSSIEGGFVLARTTRDLDSFRALGTSLGSMIAAEIPGFEPDRQRNSGAP